MRRMAVVALAVLFMPLMPLPASAVAPAPMEWWGPTAIGEGFHMRIPVTVQNDHAFPVTNAPVALEIDIAQKLSEAGWISNPSGSRDVLAGFHLDVDSIRVVAMTNLRAQDNFNGRLKVSEPSYPAGDLQRFEVASQVLEGRISTPSNFDAAVEPVVTVLWRVPQTMEPGDRAFFVVYFDSDLAHDKKAPYDPTRTLAGGDVDSLFWSGPALTSFGYVSPPPGQPGSIHLIALHGETSAQVFTAVPGQPFQPVAGESEVFLGDAYDSVSKPVTTSGPVLVKVVADKPLIVQGVSAGFVPSLDGGMTGRDFVFALTHDAAWEQDTLYVNALDPRGATESTTVVVTRLGSGAQRTFTTQNEDNPFSYTQGPRAGFSSGGNSCRTGGYPSPLLPLGPGVYRAQVTEGERVSLQLLAVGGMSQVPGANGGPAGTDFWSATAWSDDMFVRRGTDTFCSLTTRSASWLGLGLGGAATANATSPELAYQVSPPGSPTGSHAARFPPPQEVPSAPAVGGPREISLDDASDRPIRFRASQPMVLYVGNAPMQSGMDTLRPAPHSTPVYTSTPLPQLHGPLGGVGAGRTFAGNGQAIVLAPFTNTVLQVDSTHVSGTSHERIPVAAGSHHVLADRSSNDPLRGFRVDSSMPVFVYPLNQVSAAFFAGLPAFLTASTDPAEFRGYLVDIASTDGLDPATRSTAPGEPVQYNIRITNLARTMGGGDLPDVIQLTADVPAGWIAAIDGSPVGNQPRSVSLSSQESRTMTVTVTPPQNLPSGQSGTVSLTATSQGNPRMQDGLDLITFVKTVFDVGIWFDGVDGTKVQENRTLDPQGRGGFSLVLLNQGSKAELVHLSTAFKGGETAWDAALGPGGGTTLDVMLHPEIPKTVPLTVTAPENLVDGEASVVVTAELADVPAARDAVQAIAVLAAPSDLRLEVSSLTRFVRPGQTAAFDVTLHNLGQGGATVRLDARTDLTAGWDAPRIVLAGTEQELEEIALTAQESVRLQVLVPSHDGASAGASTTLRFAARPVGVSEAREAILTGKVTADHRVEMILPPLPLGIARLAEDVPFELRLHNEGNLNESLSILPEDIPAGWTLTVPPEVFVPRGATQAVPLAVQAPPGTAAGLYPLTLRVVASDGNTTRLPMEAQIGSVPTQRLQEAGAREVQPGRPASADVPIANDGNLPLVVRVEPDPDEPWPLRPALPFTLLPGERTTMTVAWDVPPGAPDGASTHHARIRSEPADRPGEAEVQRVDSVFDVGRADLVWGDVQIREAAAGHLVHGVLENRGQRPAREFVVQLLIEGQVMDEVAVGELLPGGSVQVDFLRFREGVTVLLADGGGAVVEADESNNRHDASEPRKGRQAPAPASILVLSCLAAGMLRRRR